ncbi:sugar transferase, partial [Coprobacillus cateniformis]|nr:sugar transferase [Coprobacillus cateniformis]
SMAINLLDSPLYLMKNRGLSFEQQFIKRILDLIICIPMLIILFPVFVVVAIMIKCEDGGPIFYKQSRLTLHGKEFQIYKFRSMIPDAEKVNGVQFMSNDDPRVTKIGRVTRKLRIDELPQLINIIKGEMSIVGPRPERPEVFDKLCEEFPEFRYRLTGKAGLTGYAQVMGKYNTALEDKLVFDLMYLENYSVVFDLKIILMTFKTIFDFHATE